MLHSPQQLNECLYHFPHSDICKLSYVYCGLSDRNYCRYCRICEWIAFAFSCWYSPELFIAFPCTSNFLELNVYKRKDKRRHCFSDQQFDQKYWEYWDTWLLRPKFRLAKLKNTISLYFSKANGITILQESGHKSRGHHRILKQLLSFEKDKKLAKIHQ